MKKIAFALISFLFPSKSLAADPTCSKGLLHPNSTIPACCDSICGDSCGTESCNEVSIESCCGFAIMAEDKSCDTNDPPCVMAIDDGGDAIDSKDEEVCSNKGGILGLDGITCCLSSCGSCGGTGCDKRTGGIEGCCSTFILATSKTCDINDPPCLAGSPPEVCSDIGGLLSNDSTSCCPKSCGSCGGLDCHLKPGGKENCCSSSIQVANKSCDTNAPPCTVGETKTTATPTKAPTESSTPAPIKNSDGVKRYIGVGVYTSVKTPQSREKDLGIDVFDYRLVFQKIFSLNYSEIKRIKGDGYTPILNLEFLTDSREPVLKKILSGTYDKQLKSFAQDCAEGGISFWIRTLHEFNGNWYPWGIYYSYEGKQSNTTADLKLSMQRIIKIFKDAKAPVKFQLDINAQNGYDSPRPFSYFWPGTEGIDAVTITSYNRAFSTVNHQYSNSFYEGFKEPYEQILKLTDLPIWVAETGTTSYETDKPKWLKDCFRSIALDFPKVVQVTFFLENKFQEGKLTDWDLNTEQDKKAFVDGFLNMRALTS